jgi:hypothetical protein
MASFGCTEDDDGLDIVAVTVETDSIVARNYNGAQQTTGSIRERCGPRPHSAPVSTAAQSARVRTFLDRELTNPRSGGSGSSYGTSRRS